jgi:hypothetical protein
MKEKTLPKVTTLTRAQAREILDRRARKELGISGDVFVRRWNAGKYSKRERPEVIRVAMLLPFAR